jgi:hypothetical protein
MMASRDLETKGLGWQSSGHVIEAAYKAGFLRPIKNKPKGKTKFLKLLVPLPQLHPVSTTLPPSGPIFIPYP